MLMLGFEGLTRFYDTFALSRVKIMDDSSKNIICHSTVNRTVVYFYYNQEGALCSTCCKSLLYLHRFPCLIIKAHKKENLVEIIFNLCEVLVLIIAGYRNSLFVF